MYQVGGGRSSAATCGVGNREGNPLNIGLQSVNHSSLGSSRLPTPKDAACHEERQRREQMARDGVTEREKEGIVDEKARNEAAIGPSDGERNKGRDK